MDYADPLKMNAVSYDFDTLVQRAKSGAFAPRRGATMATASAFASWVYSLSHPESINRQKHADEKFFVAKEQEIHIEVMMANFTSPRYRLKAKDWKVLYVDPLNSSTCNQQFEASRLKVDGQPVRCRPDIVFFNYTSRELLIVERKVAVTSAASIPSSCYPNVLAQLWVYSHMNLEMAGWPLAKKVLLGAELWSNSRFESPDDGRKSYWIWTKGDSVFKPVQELFKLYGGLVTPRSVADAS